jgi:hypothetical protein
MIYLDRKQGACILLWCCHELQHTDALNKLTRSIEENEIRIKDYNVCKVKIKVKINKMIYFFINRY